MSETIGPFNLTPLLVNLFIAGKIIFFSSELELISALCGLRPKIPILGFLLKTNLKFLFKELILVNPRYYRPSEVELLQGDPTYAQDKLGWKSETTLEELVKIMVEYDLNFDGYGFD